MPNIENPIENPYEWPNETLVDQFMSACGRAGVSNSGFVIDICGSSYLDRAHYLKGALLARLSGIKPPFRPGDKVRMRSGRSKKEFKIIEIIYQGERWWLHFDEFRKDFDDGERFIVGRGDYVSMLAEEFEKTTKPAMCP